MIRFVADENFTYAVLLGIRRLHPEIDIVRVQDIGLSGVDDPALLAWAASHRRLVLTHDASTMTLFAYERIKQGLTMPGLFVVASEQEVSQVIESVVLIAFCSDESDWNLQVRFLPL